MAIRNPRRLACMVTLALLGSSGVVFLAVTDWRHPFSYLEGRREAKREIDLGAATFLEPGCVPEIGRVDLATGLPIGITGLMSDQGEARFRGYMEEIELARRKGRLESCSVWRKILTMEAALRVFEKGPRTRIALGEPAVTSPDGRYEIHAERASWDENPIHPAFCVVLSDHRADSKYKLWVWGRESEIQFVEIVPCSAWTSLLFRESRSLRIIDLPRGLTLQAFEDAWPKDDSLVPPGGPKER